MVPAEDTRLGSVAKNLASRSTILSTNCLCLWQIFIFSEHPSLLSGCGSIEWCTASQELNPMKRHCRDTDSRDKKNLLWKLSCPLCAGWSYSRWRISKKTSRSFLSIRIPIPYCLPFHGNHLTEQWNRNGCHDLQCLFGCFVFCLTFYFGTWAGYCSWAI